MKYAVALFLFTITISDCDFKIMKTRFLILVLVVLTTATCNDNLKLFQKTNANDDRPLVNRVAESPEFYNFLVHTIDFKQKSEKSPFVLSPVGYSGYTVITVFLTFCSNSKR